MADESEHFHSDTAYEMLEPYLIGQLVTADKALPSTLSASDSAVDLRKQDNHFIDVKKPMFQQVLFGKFDKDYYVQQVHIPRHAPGSPPLFGGLLEPLTKTYWWVIPLFWGPFITYNFLRASSVLSLSMALVCFVVGLFNWTLIEYSLHRFVFHLDALLPNNRLLMALHFVTHGVHHFLPMDKYVFILGKQCGFFLVEEAMPPNRPKGPHLA
jgi:4-hydroxysphinganine ceramide fatty acyl 2-hydroxylase